MRNDFPDFKAAAEREREKCICAAMERMRSRVFADTKSGLVNARETVDVDTPAASATS